MMSESDKSYIMNSLTDLFRRVQALEDKGKRLGPSSKQIPLSSEELMESIKQSFKE